MFRPAYGAHGHSVYIYMPEHMPDRAFDGDSGSGSSTGATAQRITVAQTKVAELAGGANVASLSLAKIVLQPNTTYRWRVDAAVGDTQYEGLIWQFATMEKGPAAMACDVA
jgi:hypothetical protein